MRMFYLLGAFALIGTFLSGCSCERSGDSGTKPVEASGPPLPLTAQQVPKGLNVEVSPQIGATDPRPIAIVVAQDSSSCGTVKEEWKSSGHVLCIDEAFEAAEPRLKRAIAYLKETYPRHTGKPPVHLFTDDARSEVGWRLMLKEPGFFSYGYLPGLKEKALTHTTLSALHSRGARSLAVGIDGSKRLELLKNVAARRGLQVLPLGSGSGTLRQAVALLKARDARLAPPEQSDKGPQPLREQQADTKEPPTKKQQAAPTLP